jgi:hypothetical protein
MHEQTGPRCYRIVVRGRLTGPIADGFEHLELDSGGGERTLTGRLHDQAQLHGLLDRLRDLGIPSSASTPSNDGINPKGTTK